MKKLIIILIVFSSCSKDTVFEPILDEKCNCKRNLVQVTINGTHLVRNTTNALIDCDEDGLVFGRKYSGSKLIQYNKYICN